MPAKAWLHVHEDDLSDQYIPRSGGRNNELTGLARCYKLSEPVDFDGDGVPDEYLVARVLFERDHMHPEVAIFPSDERGHITSEHVRRRGGSFTIPGGSCPKGNEHAIEWVIALALSFHDITLTDPPPPPVDNPEVDEWKSPELPPGLDYDPDVLPDDTWYHKR